MIQRGAVSKAGSEPAVAAGVGFSVILVVDDDEAVVTVMASVLRNSGHVVATAVDGAEGLEVFEREAAAIDLVITDLNMPRMNGAEMATEIRRRDPEVPVLVVSGMYSEDQDKRPDGGRLFAEALSKPFTVSQLLGMVERHLPPRAAAEAEG